MSEIPGAHRKFTPAEDRLLCALVAAYGRRWKVVAGSVPGRSARQCRERYINYLAPELRAQPWSPDEDAQLLSLVAELGPRWAQIQRFFPSRSYVSVKNRWSVLHVKCTPRARLELSSAPAPLPPISSFDAPRPADSQSQLSESAAKSQQSFPYFGGYVW